MYIHRHTLRQRLGFGTEVTRKQMSNLTFSCGIEKWSPRENKGRYLLSDGYLEFRQVYVPILACNLAVVPLPCSRSSRRGLGSWGLAVGTREARQGHAQTSLLLSLLLAASVSGTISTEVNIYRRLACLISNINIVINATMQQPLLLPQQVLCSAYTQDGTSLPSYQLNTYLLSTCA